MKRTLAALGMALLASAAALPASATGPQPPTGDRAPAEHGMMHGGMHGGPGRPDFRAGPRPEGRWSPQMRLAARLAAAETLVGIRANQLDAWRDYTSALLALVTPPPPPPAAEPGAPPKPFAREERMIRSITDRAAKAATLEKAIAALRTTLTADQLERLATVSLRLGPPRMGPGGPDRGPGGPGPHRFGPGGPERDAPPPPPAGGGERGAQRMMMEPGMEGPAAAPADDEGMDEFDVAPEGAPDIPDNSNQPATAPRPG